MDRPTATASPRLLLWGVVAPLLVGAFVPPLAGLAMLWLVCGLGTLMVTGATAALRADALEDDGDDDGHDDGCAEDETSVAHGHWWRLVDEDPNTAAARAGSWG